MALGENAAKLMLQQGSAMLSSMNDCIIASDLISRELEKEPDPERRELLTQQLAALRHNQFRVLRMADQMKTLAALELGSLSRQNETVDLRQFCADLVEACGTLIPDTPVRLLPCTGDFFCYCDPGLLERLLLNLISNSLLHCSGDNEVRIQLLRTEDTLQIIVSDNGSGIPREKMESLFSDYLRNHSFRETDCGAGLGLSVAEAIAKAHGGSLIISSEEGHGTKAVFSLPHALSGELRSSRAVYQSRGRMRSILMGLSDVCDLHHYLPHFL